MNFRAALLGAAAIATVSTAQPAGAGTVTMTFQGLQNLEQIENFYNGGTGSEGSGPGPNYGVSFGSDSLALISGASGGSGSFSNAPGGNTVAFFLTGTGDVMNVAAGFTTGFSFYYAAAHSGSVSVYSGLSGTGTLLASINLAATPDPYTVWDPVGVTFAGVAESAVFSGSANLIAFDNITLGSSTPGTGTGVPEPASMTLLAAGLAGLGVARRRRRSG